MCSQLETIVALDVIWLFSFLEQEPTLLCAKQGFDFFPLPCTLSSYLLLGRVGVRGNHSDGGCGVGRNLHGSVSQDGGTSGIVGYQPLSYQAKLHH